MATLVLTVTETLRYRGKIGQWSWALHRITGLGTLLFLFLHIIDTSWAVFYPDLYKEAIAVYQSPLFTVGEFLLVACVIYHAFNGFRIALFDWRPQWWRHQALAARIVVIATLVLLIPTWAIMFVGTLNYYQTAGLDLKLPLLISTQTRFAIGIVVIAIAGILVSAVYSLIPGVNASKKGKASRFDRFMWIFMRVSGVIALPLVFGHLGMIHVIQGVFDITSHTVPVGTTLGPNISGSAPEFVALRWNTMFAGVFIWRLYDASLGALGVIHGFNGLRYVVNDYVHNRIINRGLNIAILGTAVGLILVATLAVMSNVPASTFQMLTSPANVH